MSTAKKTLGKTLTPAQLAEAKALWESGEVTLDDLAARFSVRRETMSRRLKQMGAKKGAKAQENAERVEKEVQEQLVDSAGVLASRIRETKESHYKWSEYLAKAAMGELAKAQKEGRQIATTLPNLKAIEKALQVVEKARSERYAILGLDKDDDDEGDLPDLVIKEMTAEDIEELRVVQAQSPYGEDDPDLEVIEELPE